MDKYYHVQGFLKKLFTKVWKKMFNKKTSFFLVDVITYFTLKFVPIYSTTITRMNVRL